MHIPDSEIDPNSRHLVPSDKDEGESLENAIDFSIDFDDAKFEATSETPSSEHSGNHTHHDNHAIHVASWQWDYVRTPFIYTAVIIVAGFCKIGKFKTFINFSVPT